MLHESSLAFEQIDRANNDRAALENYQESIADFHQELTAEGKWDGLIGADPKLPQDNRYWFAYCDALRGVWLKKLGIELEKVALSEETSDKPLATVEEF